MLWELTVDLEQRADAGWREAIAQRRAAHAPWCSFCEGVGWGHFVANLGLAIERCDTCGRFPDDESALRAHRTECGCGWLEGPDNGVGR